MDDTPICPPWWPRLLWDLHYIPRPYPGPGPINYPPVVEAIMAGLAMHTMSYLLLDQPKAQTLRGEVEKQMVDSIQSMSRLHDEAIARRQVQE